MVLVGYRGSKKQGHEVYLLCYMIDRYKEENFNIFYNSMTSKISKILTGAVIDNLINDCRYIKGKFICKKPFLENWAVIAKTGIYGGWYKQVSLGKNYGTDHLKLEINYPTFKTLRLLY